LIVTLPNLTEELTEKLISVGYVPRRSDVLALAGVLTAPGQAGLRAVLLEGPPGTGKSAFAEAVFQVIRGNGDRVEFIVYQCHSWSDADELFVGVDVAAAVAGDSGSVRQDGVLAKVARASERGMVVLLLDEIDKTMQRTEALLLDWLQSGRVPVRPGVQIQTTMNNVLCFITSNAHRELSDALMRRVRRVMMQPLPIAQQERLLMVRTNLPPGFVRVLWKLAREIAVYEGNNALSLQEGVRALHEAFSFSGDQGDLALTLTGWAARNNKGRDYVRDKVIGSRNLSAAWSELCRARQLVKAEAEKEEARHAV
jgi:MoxR-like ATPase